MSKKCFIISPIGDPGSEIRKRADLVFHYILSPPLKELGYELRRADHDPEPGMITDQVIRAILCDDLVIADLTGQNPNVYYEIGLRHAAAKPIVHVAELGTRIPFDNGGYKAIFFETTDFHSHQTAKASLSDAIKAIERPGYVASNPVTQSRGLLKLTESADTRDQVVADLMGRLDKLEATIARTQPQTGDERANIRKIMLSAATENAAKKTGVVGNAFADESRGVAREAIVRALMGEPHE